MVPPPIFQDGHFFPKLTHFEQLNVKNKQNAEVLWNYASQVIEFTKNFCKNVILWIMHFFDVCFGT